MATIAIYVYQSRSKLWTLSVDPIETFGDINESLNEEFNDKPKPQTDA